MLSFQSIAKVNKDHALAVSLPTTLEEGEYPVLVVLQESPHTPKRRLTFADHHLGTTSGETFHRDDLYSDDGR
jgi:hypothetical protein